MTRAIHYRRFDHPKYRFILAAPLTLDTNIIGRACKTEWVELKADGTLVITNRYAWDGASGIAINTENAIAASCGHDALYQLMDLGLLPLTQRLKADACLRRWLIEDGMIELRANLWFFAVRLFGELYIKRR